MKGTIKKGVSFEDFKNVYKVFSGAPYFEKYTEEEYREIYDEYNRKGVIIGAYNEDECIGLIAFEDGFKKEQGVDYKDKKVTYLADIAVLEKYRKLGLGTQLMIYGILESKKSGYDIIYMRTLEEGQSMSYGIAKRVGFNQIPNLSQTVTRERMNGNIETVNNIFLEYDLERMNKKALKEELDKALDLRVKSLEGGSFDGRSQRSIKEFSEI